MMSEAVIDLPERDKAWSWALQWALATRTTYAAATLSAGPRAGGLTEVSDKQGRRPHQGQHDILLHLHVIRYL